MKATEGPFSDCEFCGHDKPHCGAPHPKWAICTREKNHEGPHVACGITDHKVMKWKQLDSKAEEHAS